MKEEEGFLKVYLQLLKSVLEDNSITFPNSRWKNLHRGLKVVGLNKTEDKYKVMTLIDCLTAPWFLASSVEQYQLVQTLNDELVLRLVGLYGAAKFLKYLSSHFWFSQHVISTITQRKTYIQKKVEELPNNPTFFYPCSKFPQNVSLSWERLGPPSSGSRGTLIVDLDMSHYKIGYRVRGYDKKLMSDKYIEIHPERGYRLELEMKTSHKMLVYVGLACYDQAKRFINTIQICRRKNTEVVFDSLEGDAIVVD